MMPGYVAESVALKTVTMHAEHFGWELRLEGPLEIRLVRRKVRLRVVFTRRGQISIAEKISGRTKTTAANNKLNTVLDWMEEK